MGKKRVIKETEEQLVKEVGEIEEKSAVAIAEEAQKGGKRKLTEGRAYVYSSYNNTLMTLTDERGNVLIGVGAGRAGFKGAKKSTPFAASKVAEMIAGYAKDHGMERVHVFVRGVGSGRDSAVRSLGMKGLDLLSITDITPIPHNGPRPKKPRRV